MIEVFAVFIELVAMMESGLHLISERDDKRGREKVVADVSEHTGASEMFLVALVNATFVARRPTGHVELVDLAVEKKEAVERYNKEVLQNGNDLRSCGSSREVEKRRRASASPRRRAGALEEEPAADHDLCTAPLFEPLFLGSPSSGSSSSEAEIALRAMQELRVGHNRRDTETRPWSLETSLPVVEKTSGTASDQGFRSDNHPEMKQAEQTMADGSKTIKPTKTRVAPKLGSLFSEGGVSTRVQRHPLEVIAEQEDGHGRDTDSSAKGNAVVKSKSNSAEHVVREKIDLSARVLQHPLERIDERLPVKERKPAAMRKERKTGAAPSPQPVRRIVRDSKPDVKQPQKRERPKLRESRAPITKPRSPIPKPGNAQRPEASNDQEKPSLANPVMETMPAAASPEPPYAWNKKFQNLPKLAVSSVDTEPLVEERELRYSSPKMTESDAQDDLSFRVWERESKPKRKSISVSRDFQDSLDLESSHEFEAREREPTARAPKEEEGKAEKALEDGNLVVPPLSAFDLRRKTATIPNVAVDTRNCEDEVQHEYPSPSSFTCGLSPTSLFSDDDNMLSRFQPFPSFGSRRGAASATLCKSPRSVLSQEPDDISHFTSDSSTERRGSHRQHRMYNDESSDLESLVDGAKNVEAELNRRSFATFKYTDRGMGETSSDEEGRGADFSDLRYFQEAGNREPWLEKDGGVLDDTDLEFLLPPDFRDDDAPSVPHAHERPVSEIPQVNSPQESPRSPNLCQTAWVPYVTGTEAAPVRSPARGGLLRPRSHTRSSSFSKSKDNVNPQSRPPKRSVKFAPEVAREMTISTSRNSIRLPRPDSSNVKDEDEQIYPSVKSWEVDDEEASTTSTPRSRRWRRPPIPKPTNQPALDHVVDDEGAPGPSVMHASRSRRWRRSLCDENGDGDVDPTPSRRHRVAHILPCAGRLFSWPQRLAFRVSRSRRLDSDDDSAVGTESSFGRSARRDAQQVRRILKGSRKKFSSLTVADVLDDSFG